METGDIGGAAEAGGLFQEKRRSSPYPLGQVLEHEDEAKGQQYLSQTVETKLAQQIPLDQHAQAPHGEHRHDDRKGEAARRLHNRKPDIAAQQVKRTVGKVDDAA